MPVAQEDPNTTQLPSTNHHPVFFTSTTTSTSYINNALTTTAAEAGGPPGASAKEAAEAAAHDHEAGGGRGGPGGHSVASAKEVVIAALDDVDTHKQLSHTHIGRFAPSLFDQGWRERDFFCRKIISIWGNNRELVVIPKKSPILLD